MFDHSKTFFSEKSALEFIERLEYNGITDIELSSYRDGWGDIAYRVAWNED